MTKDNAEKLLQEFLKAKEAKAEYDQLRKEVLTLKPGQYGDLLLDFQERTTIKVKPDLLAAMAKLSIEELAEMGAVKLVPEVDKKALEVLVVQGKLTQKAIDSASAESTSVVVNVNVAE
jgi:hypothetical protein